MGADALLWPDDRGRLRVPAWAVAGIVAGRRDPLALAIYEGVVCLWSGFSVSAPYAADFIGQLEVEALGDGSVVVTARQLADAGMSGWSVRTLTVWADEVNVT